MNVVVKNMIPTASRASCVLVAVLSFASVANAQNAFTNRTVKLHAGPDRNYPTVSVVGPGAMVYVNGCLRNFNWCDVQAGPTRGWANARSLNYTYGGRPMAIYGNGVRFGLPVVGYVMGSYWDNHYRTQPWYNTHRHNWQPNRAYVAPRAPMHQPHVNGFAPAPRPQIHTRPVPTQQHFAPQHQEHQRPVVVQQRMAPQHQPQRQHLQQPQHSQRAQASHPQHRP
ncbi:MAG: hypothetical protein ABL985_02785 [Casimicrobium sp.]